LPQQAGLQADVRLRFRLQGPRRGDRFPLGGILGLQRVCGLQLCGLRPLMGTVLRIGTRGSRLALWQAHRVKSLLDQIHPHLSIEIVIIKTTGDRILDVPLARVGGKGLFVKEIEQALLEKRIDLAVHSLKDMPAEIPAGLALGAIPEREAAGDVLISRHKQRFYELPRGAVIGTSSLRRAAQLRHARPDVTLVPLRGNLDTRIRKLQTESLDAIVVAAAGVKRLGLEEHISQYLDEELMLPAVGQGALCVEIRKDDPLVAPLAAALDHASTRAVVTAERAFLHRLGGSCQVPIAGHGRAEGERLLLSGLVADVDGSTVIRAGTSGPLDSGKRIGNRLAADLISRGADRILEKIKGTSG